MPLPFLPVPHLFFFAFVLLSSKVFPPLPFGCSVCVVGARASCCDDAEWACVFFPRPLPLGDLERASLRAFLSFAFSRLSSLRLLSPRLALAIVRTLIQRFIFWAWSSYSAHKNWIRVLFCCPLDRLLPELVLVFQTVPPAGSDHLFACNLLFNLEHVFNSSSNMSDQVLSLNSSYKRRPGCRICAKSHMLLIIRNLVRNCSVFCGMVERYQRRVWIISDASKELWRGALDGCSFPNFFLNSRIKEAQSSLSSSTGSHHAFSGQRASSFWCPIALWHWTTLWKSWPPRVCLQTLLCRAGKPSPMSSLCLLRPHRVRRRAGGPRSHRT